MKKYKSAILPFVTLLVAILIFLIDHDKGIQVAVLFVNTCKSTIPILLLMFLLLSFLKFGMDTGKLQKNISKKNGIRNTIFAYLFGTLVSGPIYPGFALSKMLMQSGVKVKIVVIMLSVWATLKIPMLPYELKILGPKLCMIRWIVTGVIIFFLAMVCDKIYSIADKKSTEEYLMKQEERITENE